MKTKESLLKDAVGIDEKVAQWRSDSDFVNGALLIAEAIHNNNRSAAVYQSPHFPEFALLAYLDEKISLAQFASLTFRWDARMDFGAEVEDIQHYSLNAHNSLAAEALRPFLRLLVSSGWGQRGQVNVEFPQNEFEEFITSLQAETIHESERCFTLLRLNNQAKLPPLYYVFQELGFSLFMPINDEGQYIVLVPSFTMLENFLKILSPTPIELCPVIGETEGDAVLKFHQNNAHPLGLSFPGYEHEKADGHVSKRLMFVYHDIYHIVLLVFVKMLKLVNNSAEITQQYLRDKGFSEDSLLQQRAGILVDAEQGEYYRLAVFKKLKMVKLLEKYKEFQSGELNFALLLAHVLMDKIPGLEDDKPSAIEQQTQIVALIIADLINNRRAWRERGIDVAKCLLCFTSTDNLVELLNNSVPESAEAMDEFRVLTLNGITLLNQIVHDMLSSKKYHELINDEESRSWLKQIPECQDRLFAAANKSDIGALEQCLQLIREQQLPISIKTQDKQGRTVLVVAVMKQNIPMVARLLEEGADVNTIVSKPETKDLGDKRSIVCGTRAVHLAAQKNNTQLLALLIARGANLDVYDSLQRAPIDIAIECGHVEAFNLLIQHCDMSDSHISYLKEKNTLDDEMELCLTKYQKQRTQFTELLEYGDNESIKVFLLEHSHFSIHRSLLEASYAPLKNPFMLVPEDSQLVSPFKMALRRNKLPLLKLLFERAPANQERDQDLIMSLQSEVVRAGFWNPSAIEKLDIILAHGASLNGYCAIQEGLFAGAKTWTIWTLLRDISYSKGFLAIELDNTLTMSTHVRKLCIHYGADVNAPNKNGMPELISAVIVEDLDYAAFLLDHQANVNIFDQSSSRFGTALHVASAMGNKPLVELLMARGADLTLGNSKGLTPWQLAQLNGHGDHLAECFPASAQTLRESSGHQVNPCELASFTFDAACANDIHFDRLELFSSCPEFRDKIRELRSNPMVEIGSVKLCAQLGEKSVDYDHPIFKGASLWQYALSALHKKAIKKTQFATLAIRMAYLQNFPRTFNQPSIFHSLPIINMLKRP